MSDSKKKHPGFVDRNPFAKNQANRRIRRYKGEVGNGGWYKRFYSQYDICDWSNLYWSKDKIQKYEKYWDPWIIKHPWIRNNSGTYRLYMK